VIPIFDDGLFPPPDADALAQARWPKSKQILARGVLALSLRAGAQDIADGSPATAANVVRREYHHLFPDSLLQKVAGCSQEESFRALNCALVTWTTNRHLSAKDPLQYLRERTERAALGEEAVRSRLDSHLVPYMPLAAASFDDDAASSGEVLHARYEAFIAARATLVAEQARIVCDVPPP
jgi:hypothetical protein